MIRAMILSVVMIGSAMSAQAFTLSVQAELDALQADIHLLGVKTDALIGADSWDIPEPPAPPSSYLALAIAMPDAGAPFPNRWRHEFRPFDVFEDGVELWELSLETDQTGQVVTLIIDLEVGDTSELEIFVLGSWGRNRMELPLFLEVPVNSGSETIWLEVHWDSPLSEESESAGSLKARYR